MKPKLSVPIIVSLIVATLNAGVGIPQSRLILARTIEVKGTVELKREESSSWRPMKEGERLFYGDLLRVQKGSRGVIQCTTDLTEWTVPDDGLPRGVANTCSLPE
ncbi:MULTISPECIES: hypothetical protein [unclassified Coleofasciculus]|uniref:hypothetical protein n=1 Tax=unclassified Coleofasciculus TaxID=2692782 RepID=UPI001882CECC|nr:MULTISPECIES: hypothetical protein [unclassified Coleofasciculus]MBE9127219.1 hypothetical protein [Coleofasciculus sp. LEGE 07081]MBE9150511.1 hypothetical protein [Coleofasciculus sp. LEGE 07092]